MAKMKKKGLKKKAPPMDADTRMAETGKKYKKRPIKVIHAPLNFAGQAYALSRALRAEGIDSRFYRLKVKGQHGEDSGDVYGYKDDGVLKFTWANQFGDLIRCTQHVIDEK